jgi:hypothetical protein
MCHTLIPQAQNTAAQLCGAGCPRSRTYAGRRLWPEGKTRAPLRERERGGLVNRTAPCRCAAYHRDLQSKACNRRAAQPATPSALVTRCGDSPAPFPVRSHAYVPPQQPRTPASAHLCPALPTGTLWPCYSLKRQGTHPVHKRRYHRRRSRPCMAPLLSARFGASTPGHRASLPWTHTSSNRGPSQRQTLAHHLLPARARAMRACSKGAQHAGWGARRCPRVRLTRRPAQSWACGRGRGCRRGRRRPRWHTAPRSRPAAVGLPAATPTGAAGGAGAPAPARPHIPAR